MESVAHTQLQRHWMPGLHMSSERNEEVVKLTGSEASDIV